MRRASIAITTALLLLGAAAFLAGSCLCASQPDYRREAAGNAAVPADGEGEPSMPLLADDAEVPSRV